jgi:hypothetical protein
MRSKTTLSVADPIAGAEVGTKAAATTTASVIKLRLIDLPAAAARVN